MGERCQRHSYRLQRLDFLGLNLAFHGWEKLIELAIAVGRDQAVDLVTPHAGGVVAAGAPLASAPCWEIPRWPQALMENSPSSHVGRRTVANARIGSKLTVRWAAVWQESIESGRKGRWHPLGQVGDSA